MVDSPRVPLRRLKTNRFKTLQQRQEDNARRRAKYAADKQGISWQTVKQNLRVTDSQVVVPWSGVAIAVKNPASYAKALAAIEQSRQNYNRWVEGGAETVPEGVEAWQNRDPDLPEELYYYHGIFG